MCFQFANFFALGRFANSAMSSSLRRNRAEIEAWICLHKSSRDPQAKAWEPRDFIRSAPLKAFSLHGSAIDDAGWRNAYLNPRRINPIVNFGKQPSLALATDTFHFRSQELRSARGRKCLFERCHIGRYLSH
jgi:hypothetical protein